MADILKRIFAALAVLVCLCACTAPAADPSGTEDSAASGASQSAVQSSGASSSADAGASGAETEGSSSASGVSGAASVSGGGADGAQSVSVPAASQGGAVSSSKSTSASASRSQSQNASQSKSQSASQSQSKSQSQSQSQEITVSVTVDCSAAFGNLVSGDDSFLPQSGIMLSTSVTVAKGSSAFEAMQAACQSGGLSLNYSGSQARRNVYIQGAGGLSEKDCGGQSGWKYSVNGTTPGKGCSAYTLGDGDTVLLYYAMS